MALGSVMSSRCWLGDQSRCSAADQDVLFSPVPGEESKSLWIPLGGDRELGAIAVLTFALKL